MIKDNVEEDREATMAKFLNGLNKNIANLIDLHLYVEVEDLVNLAMKVEKKLKGKRYNSKPTFGSTSSSWKSSWGKKDEKNITKSKEDENKNKSDLDNKGKNEAKLTQTREIQCFKYLGSGHITRECPNKKNYDFKGW